jgi:DNA polymerase I
MKLPDLPEFLTRKNPYEVFLSDNYLVVDFETSNLDYGFAGNPKNKLLLSAYCGPDGKVHCDSGDEFSQEPLFNAIKRADFIVCQNAKFELQWLARMGYPIEDLVLFDTMLAEYVWLGNRQGPKNLDALAIKYGAPLKNSVVKSLIEGGVCPSLIPTKWLEEYNAQDVRTTQHVFLAQRAILLKEKLLPVLFTRCVTTPVLAEIELAGMHLDKEGVNNEYLATKAKYDSEQERFRLITGGINLSSPKQVGAFLYDKLGFRELQSHKGEPLRTEAGGRRTDEDAIKALKATTPEQQAFKEAFLTIKPLVKRLDTLEKMHACTTENSGHLLASLNQAVTATHRLSSSGKQYRIQYQNIDRDLKSLFSAREEGWLVGEADGASLEFRGAGHLGKDRAIKRLIEAGGDPHMLSATAVFNIPKEKVTSDIRTAAKAETFRPLYGASSGTPAQLRYLAAFRQEYSDLYKVQTEWTLRVARDKRLVTEWGMVFYWPNCKISRSGYVEGTTQIFNYPVQSFSTAEIIPISLVCFWHRLKRSALRMFLTNTVHDSIVAELPPDETDAFHDLSRVSFLDDCPSFLRRNYGVDLFVPLGCEVKVGSHWSRGKGAKYEQKLN